MCDNVEVMKFTITHRISIAAIVVPAVLAILFNNDAAKTNVNGSGNAIAVGANANAIVNNFHPIERHMSNEKWHEIQSMMNVRGFTKDKTINVTISNIDSEKNAYANEIVEKLNLEGFKTNPEGPGSTFSDVPFTGIEYYYDQYKNQIIVVGENK